MNTSKHNPDYKLISVTIDNKEFVYGETNEGQNKGIEIYFYKPGANHFYYSRRYKDGAQPQVYTELYNNLQKQKKNVSPGYKLYLSLTDYRAISKP